MTSLRFALLAIVFAMLATQAIAQTQENRTHENLLQKLQMDVAKRKICEDCKLDAAENEERCAKMHPGRAESSCAGQRAYWKNRCGNIFTDSWRCID